MLRMLLRSLEKFIRQKQQVINDLKFFGSEFLDIIIRIYLKRIQI